MICLLEGNHLWRLDGQDTQRLELQSGEDREASELQQADACSPDVRHVNNAVTQLCRGQAPVTAFLANIGDVVRVCRSMR